MLPTELGRSSLPIRWNRMELFQGLESAFHAVVAEFIISAIFFCLAGLGDKNKAGCAFAISGPFSSAGTLTYHFLVGIDKSSVNFT